MLLAGVAVAIARFHQISRWWEWVLLSAIVCAGAAGALATLLDREPAGMTAALLLLTVAAGAAVYGDLFAPGATPPAHSAQPASAVALTSGQSIAPSAEVFVRCRSSCAFGQTSPAGDRLSAGTVLMPGMATVLARLTPIARSEIAMSAEAHRADRAVGAPWRLVERRSRNRHP